MLAMASILFCCRPRLAPLLMCLPSCWQHVVMSQMLTRMRVAAAGIRMTSCLRAGSSAHRRSSSC